MVKEKRARHQLLPVAPTLECGSGPHPGLLSQEAAHLGGGTPPPQPEEVPDATRHGLQSLEAGPAANVEAHTFTHVRFIPCPLPRQPSYQALRPIKGEEMDQNQFKTTGHKGRRERGLAVKSFPCPCCRQQRAMCVRAQPSAWERTAVG